MQVVYPQRSILAAFDKKLRRFFCNFRVRQHRFKYNIAMVKFEDKCLKVEKKQFHTCKFLKTPSGILDMLLLNRYKRLVLAGMSLGIVVRPRFSHHTSCGLHSQTERQDIGEVASVRATKFKVTFKIKIVQEDLIIPDIQFLLFDILTLNNLALVILNADANVLYNSLHVQNYLLQKLLPLYQ